MRHALRSPSRLRIAAFALAALACGTASGQPAWPAKPVRMIVPFAAGGPADIVGREVARALGSELGQSFVVENQGGGAGVPALNAVARAPADGYTLLFAASGNVVIQPLLVKNRVDVLTQLAPVGMVSTSPHVLVVTSQLPARNVKELIDYARANPGKVNFASAGVGGLAHLAMELFRHTAKVDVAHVPYKGTSQALADLAAGQVHAMFSSMPSMKGMIDRGAIRAIGVTAPSDSPSMKGIPVISQSGLPGFEYSTWYGLFATAGTPQPVIDRLNAALARIAAGEGLADRLEAQGVSLHVGTPRALAELTRRETAQWERVIRETGIELN